FNQILGTLLSKYLKNNYLLNILKIIPSYELNKNLNIEFNYLISLNNLDIENIIVPIIKINTENVLNNNYNLEKYDILKK
ncbi:MAG: hypothetical protein ACRDDH_01275, partial [Cetobacterium sp.]